MLRDANHQQVIQKFSFIESLNSSRGIPPSDEQILSKITPQPDLDRAFNFLPQSDSQTSQGELAVVAAAWSSDQTPNPGGKIVPYSIASASAPRHNPLPHHYQPPNRNYLGKILFALTCSYGLFVLWWLFGHQGSKLLTWVTGGQQIILSQSDVEFIDYLERSLDYIEQQLEAKPTNGESEKQIVYVPVYTPNSTPPNFPVATIPQPQVAAPEPVSEALKIPAPPPLPEPTPLPTPVDVSPPSTTPQVAVSSTQPKIQYTLIGILELGTDKSAALVKVDGQTRRVWQGEKIGNSDWVLESVTNQTVTINHQGQLREIAVGETF